MLANLKTGKVNNDLEKMKEDRPITEKYLQYRWHFRSRPNGQELQKVVVPSVTPNLST